MSETDLQAEFIGNVHAIADKAGNAVRFVRGMQRAQRIASDLVLNQLKFECTYIGIWDAYMFEVPSHSLDELEGMSLHLRSDLQDGRRE